MILASGQQADVVHAHVRDVPDEEAVLDGGRAGVQQIEGGPRRLRTVVAEDAVAKERRLLRLSEMLDRNPAAARTRVVPVDLDIFNRRIGACINLDAAAVREEERRLPDVVRLDGGFLAGSGGEIIRAGDPEAPQHGLPRDPVAEVDDRVPDRGITGSPGIRNLRIGRGEDDVADRLQRDAVMPGVEPDERLSPGEGTVSSRMDVDGLVDRIRGGSVQRVLDPVFRLDLITPRLRVERDRFVLVSDARVGVETRRKQKHDAGSTMMALHGSSMTRIWLTATFVRTCRVPLGHTTSIRFMVFRPPRQKCRRTSVVLA